MAGLLFNIFISINKKSEVIFGTHDRIFMWFMLWKERKSDSDKNNEKYWVKQIGAVSKTRAAFSNLAPQGIQIKERPFPSRLNSSPHPPDYKTIIRTYPYPVFFLVDSD